jgi:CubicO group peptidase (beta-lactamase class C family)
VRKIPRFASLLLLLAASCTAYSQAPVSSTKRMQQVIQSYVDNKTFMGAVLVAEKDRILISQGYGSADLEWNIPNSAGTKFRIGSITKQFTAASILLLQERGKLKVDEPVKTYLPDAPKTWDKITLYNLLTHTSGIPNFTSLPEFQAFKQKERTPDEIVAFFRDRPMDFEPGTKFAYSNSNYILLGRIIEKLSGETYAEFLRKNIFTPLGMTESGADNSAAILPQRAQGYSPRQGLLVHADQTLMSIPFAAGCLYSTVGDLLKWERGLFRGKVLSPASLQAMTTPFKNEYGLGVFHRDATQHSVITHNGSIDGFDARLNFYPDRQLTVVVLGNVGNGSPDRIADQLGRVAYGEKVIVTSDRKPVRVAPAVLAEYVGTYKSPTFGLTIGVEGDHLLSTTPSGQKVPLYPESQTKFFIKEFDAQVEFVRDPSTKKVTQFLVTQDGKVREVPKQ